MGGETTDYIIGHPETETEPLSVLSHAFHPFTLQVLHEAGVEKGMRVLEIGSGGGDLALLAAEYVGPSGSVVGIETSPEAVSYGMRRAQSSGLTNVSFVQAPIDQELPFEPEFDALVGRIVLMFLPSPAAVLRRLAKHVRPGGLVIFQEPDMSWAKSVPTVPTVQNAAAWMREIFKISGANSEFGPRLHAVFKEAGLPDPRMRVDGLIYGSNGAGPALLADTIRTMLPAIEQFGVATAREVDIDTLENRMRAELEGANASMSSPLLVSAWTRLPG
jgi:ubiquinone/menaquinone biosynthesis C-methylase UbiE